MNKLLVIYSNFRVGTFSPVRYALLLLLLFIFVLPGCGGGSSGDTPSVLLSGQVKAPGGQVAKLAKPGVLDTFAGLLFSSAQAMLSGLQPVADGTQVDLVKVNDAGAVESLIATTSTDKGRYSFNLTALNVGFSHNLMVRVSGFGVQMRAFVTDESVDIDPVAEAVSRLVFETIAATSGSLLSHFTVAEIQALHASVNLLTSLRDLTSESDVDSSINAVTALLMSDTGITGYLLAAAGSGQTSHNPGDVGNLFPLAQGDTWNYVVNDSDQMSPFYSAVNINGTKLLNGVTARVVSESNPVNSGVPVEEYLEKNAQGIFNHGNDDAEDFLTPQLAPYLQVRFPVLPGATQQFMNKSGLVWSQDLDEDGKSEAFSVVAQVTNTGFEAETIPVGSFPSNLRRDIKLDIEVSLSSVNETVTSTSSITEWYAPDLGLIKSRETILAQGAGGSITQSTTRALRGYRVNGSGRGFLPEFTIAGGLATANSDTESPGQAGIGFDGQNYLVVTCRENDGSGEASGVIGVFVSDTGTVANSFSIAPHACFGFSAAVAFDGVNYLVVFQRYSDGTSGSPDLFARRVSPSGNVLDGTDGFPLSQDGATKFAPAIAFDGTNYLVVYGKYSLNSTLWDIYGARVSPAGVVLGEFPVSAVSGDELSPSLAFDGTNYMVVWEHTSTGSGPSDATDVYAARVSPGGTVLDPAGIAVANAAGYQGDAHIAYDGSNYLVVWIEAGSVFIDPPVSGIYGRRLQTDGTLLDGTAETTAIAINTTSLSKGDLDLHFDGSDYFVMWRMGSFSNDPPSGVYAARVSTAGALRDIPAESEGLEVSGTPSDYSRPVHPAGLFNGSHSLLVWNNNIELSGSLKGVGGMFVYPF